MAISGNLVINIGLPNESQGSDSLYTAFNKINTNFNTLFGNASKVVPGNGISIVNNAGNTVVSANLLAGDGIALDTVNGAIRITNTGGSNGGGSSNIAGILPGNGVLINGSNSVGAFSGCVTVALSNSGVNAQSYINPTITVDQFGRVVSASNNLVTGTVTSVGLTPGSGIQIAGGPVTTSGFITVTNTGVTSLTAGTGVVLSGSNGAVTISVAGGGGGSGTVTSVGITSSQLVVTGSPIISSGNIGVNLPNNLSITGNITAGARFIGNGSGLTGVSVTANNVTGLGNVSLINLDGNASNVLHGDGTWSADVTDYSNANVASYLPTYTGNLNAGNANLGNNVSANYFTGNGFYLTGLNLSNVVANSANFAAFAGNVTVAAQSNITSVGILTGLTLAANADITLSGIGSQLAGANLISANFITGTLTTNSQPNITSVGTLASLTVTANTTTGGIKTDNYYYANGVAISFAGSYSNSNVAAYLPTYTGNITAGNVYANSGTIGAQTLKGEGGNISNIAAGNITGQVANALVAGTVYTAAQPNITSVGTLTSLSVNGNITAANITANTGIFTGNGSGLSQLAGGNVTGQVGNALVAGTVYTNAQPNITSVGTLTSLAVTGNSSAGNLSTGGTLSVTGNANVGNVGATIGLFTSDITASNVYANTFVKTTAVTFATLPAAGTAGAGARAFITDGNLVMSGNFGSLVTGGASNGVPVISDGTNWRIG
jgi:hypothetical protein